MASSHDDLCHAPRQFSRREWLGQLALVGVAAGTGFAHDSGASPEARFEWRMMNDFRPLYDQRTHTYDRAFVNPAGWVVRFDARLSRDAGDGVPIASYRWSITGIDHPYRYEVTTDRPALLTSGRRYGGLLGGKTLHAPRIPSQGAYRVTLTVEDDRGRETSTTKTVTVRDYLVVSVGDSFASGQGNPDVDGVPDTLFGVDWSDLPETWIAAGETRGGKKVVARMKRQPRWLDAAAFRSYRSGPALAARQLAYADLRRSVTFVSAATSGAAIDTGLIRSQGVYRRGQSAPGQNAVTGQLAEVLAAVGGRTIDALLISIGGNDVGFVPLLRAALKGTLFRSKDLAEAERVLADLPLRFARLADTIEAVLGPRVRNVFVTEYPVDLFSVGKRGRGTIGKRVSPAEAAALRRLGVGLNTQIAAACRAAANRRLTSRWHYIDGIASAFEPHGYCDRDTWFVQLDESVRRQGNILGAFHPNGKGHVAYAARIAAAVDSLAFSATSF